MSELTPSKKAKLDEVADLMHKIYLTLARMRYLDPLWIQPGPHPISPSLLKAYQSHNLEPSIIYLYSILPYVDTCGAESVDFFKGGYFADFRDKKEVAAGRDPFYDGVDLRPWMTPLSRLGNHQCVILFDAKWMRIGVYDQESGGNADPGLTAWIEGGGDVDMSSDEEDEVVDGDEEMEDEEEETGEDEGNQEDEEEEEEEEDDEEDEDEEGSEMSERPYDDMDSRKAREVLRDIIKWYEELTMTPGGGESSGIEWQEEIVKPLYLKHGWPGENFDGDAFLVDKARTFAAESAKDHAEQPLREVEHLEVWMAQDQSLPLQEELEAAKTDDEKWVVRWKLWQLEERNERNTKNLKVAKEKRDIACPNGQCQKPDELILWEMRELREELGSKQRTLNDKLKQAAEMEVGEREREKRPGFELCVRFAEEQVDIWQKAVKACEMDAERLCPGKSLPPKLAEDKLGMELTLKKMIEEEAASIEVMQQGVNTIRNWILQLPQSAVKARKLPLQEISSYERRIEDVAKDVDRLKKLKEDIVAKQKS